jgi:hypothetical protein
MFVEFAHSIDINSLQASTYKESLYGDAFQTLDEGSKWHDSASLRTTATKLVLGEIDQNPGLD